MIRGGLPWGYCPNDVDSPDVLPSFPRDGHVELLPGPCVTPLVHKDVPLEPLTPVSPLVEVGRREFWYLLAPAVHGIRIGSPDCHCYGLWGQVHWRSCWRGRTWVGLRHLSLSWGSCLSQLSASTVLWGASAWYYIPWLLFSTLFSFGRLKLDPNDLSTNCCLLYTLSANCYATSPFSRATDIWLRWS